MPVRVRKSGSKYRVVERDGAIAKTTKGKPRDGGGHASKEAAARQARAINMRSRR